MTKTLKTGLQFTGTSAVLLVLGIACHHPIKEKIRQGALSDLDASLFLASVLFGFIALATGLVASIYLISAGIEGIGSLISRSKPEAEEETGK